MRTPRTDLTGAPIYLLGRDYPTPEDKGDDMDKSPARRLAECPRCGDTPKPVDQRSYVCGGCCFIKVRPDTRTVLASGPSFEPDREFPFDELSWVSQEASGGA